MCGRWPAPCDRRHEPSEYVGVNAYGALLLKEDVMFDKIACLERALKEARIEADFWHECYAKARDEKDRELLEMRKACDAEYDDLKRRFQEYVRESRNPFRYLSAANKESSHG